VSKQAKKACLIYWLRLWDSCEYWHRNMGHILSTAM